MLVRVPVDLAAITRDIKNRRARASGNIETIAQSQDPIFPRPPASHVGTRAGST